MSTLPLCTHRGQNDPSLEPELQIPLIISSLFTLKDSDPSLNVPKLKLNRCVRHHQEESRGDGTYA